MTHAEYLKAMGMTSRDIYAKAFDAEGRVTEKVNMNRTMFRVALVEESYIVTIENDTGPEPSGTL